MAIQVSFLHHQPPSLQLTINDSNTEVISSIKLRGVIIKNDLKGDQQVQKLITNVSSRIYILNKLKKKMAL